MNTSYNHPLPSELILHVTAMLGEKGEQWLRDVPRLVDDLSDRWQISAGVPFPAGEYNFVAPAIGANGELSVLKIAPPFPDEEYIGEAEFLRHRNGQGTVRLLDRDHDLRAILIERAVPGKNLAELFKGRESEVIEPAIEVLKSVVGEPPADHIPKTLDSWFEGMRPAKERGYAPGYAAKAFEIYDRLSIQPGRTFYLHGDFHPGNIVSAHRSAYLAIDPKGIIGHLGYDIAVFLNNFFWWQEAKPDILERLAHAVELFSDAFEIDQRELREWAFAQMVLGEWWDFDGMSQLFDPATVAKADIWNV